MTIFADRGSWYAGARASSPAPTVVSQTPPTMVIPWVAKCPACGNDATWQQQLTQGQFGIEATDITITCPCEADTRAT